MASVNISLKKEAYERLITLKRPEESFSDEVLRITTTKTTEGLKKCIGLWKDISENDMKKIEGAVTACRKGKISDIAKKWES